MTMIQIEDERVQILGALGLTFLQAKVYLALCRTNCATVKTLSKAASVARQDVYRIMPELEKLGLAEKIIATPTKYKAIPLKEGVCFLLHKKIQQFQELQKKTMELIQNLEEIDEEATIREEQHQFILTASEKLLIKKLQEGAETAQNSIDICDTPRGLRNRLFHGFAYLKRALKRGVRIRALTEKHETTNSSQKIIRLFETSPLFEIRYLPPPLPIKTAIVDKKEVNLCLSTPNEGNDLPSLWSNNPQFVKIITNYYEELWNKAQSEANSSIKKVKTKKQKLTQQILSTSN